MQSICFVGLDNYPVLNPDYGHHYFGGESVQQTLLARAFAELGFKVSMVVGDFGQPDIETIDGIRVIKAYRPDAGLPVLRFFHPRMTRVWRALREADADVYYQSCAGVMTGIVAKFCRQRQRSFVFRLAHDTDCIRGEQLIGLWRDRKIYEYGLKHADLIFAQSEQQKALLYDNYGLDCFVLGMATELPTVESSGLSAKRDIDILWVNNLRDFKRPELVPALAELLPERNLVMIGGRVAGYDHLFSTVQTAASRQDNLSFLGAVPYADVNDYFDRAKVFVNTSDHEGFPNSFLQAWIRGVPVLSFFDPDGIIKRERLGAAPGSIEEMAVSLSGLLDDSDGLGAMSDHCRQFSLQHYSPRAVAEKYVAYFTDHMGDPE